MNTTEQPAPIELPWHIAVKTFREDLIAALIKKHGMLPSAARKHLDDHAMRFDPLIAAIINSAILEGDAEKSLKQVEFLVECFNTELIELVQDYPNATGWMEATLAMYRDALVWDTEGRTFEGWIEMMKRFFFHEGHRVIDYYNRLSETAVSIFEEDLRPFFDTHCGTEPRERETIVLKIAMFEDMIKRTKDSK